ncbi:triose-phosphate isomerase [Ktedonospora formicarum]|uniref:Triosephosphate isomerase n=1 Tax=Ktedonospora formicarum TaxID=2778364 RepID=A0A8J3I3N0_9CHLR|nr:triose-phosphate isomerase [Ktedonospora formicarum]GHO44259.1 triosephosphate isomerase [Ktedonospora formicarum]
MTTPPAKRTAIIAGNWKMNYGPQQAASFVGEILPALSEALQSQDSVLCILCPPAISLAAVHAILNIPDASATPYIELGAQNMYFEEKGAYTGEISPLMVRELCTTVILGHSERRMYFGESDELVNKKTLSALNHQLRPIVCIGENLQQYEAGETDHVLSAQLRGSLAHLTIEQAREVVIAYEPIWAIGTGNAATAEIAGKVIHHIRQEYQSMYGAEAASAVRILYGGSVTSNNIAEFMAHPDIDGALVGGASLKPDFVDIVRHTVKSIAQ